MLKIAAIFVMLSLPSPCLASLSHLSAKLADALRYGPSIEPAKYNTKVVSSKNVPEKGYRYNAKWQTNGKMLITLFVHPKFVNNTTVEAEITSELNLINNAFKKYSYNNYTVWFEIFSNAQSGHPEYIEYIARMRVFALERIAGEVFGEENIYDERLKNAKKEYSEARKKAQAHRKAAATAKANNQKIFKKFETNKVKLDDLIRQNKRAEVAKLVESYLPWLEMSPTEAVAWKKWIDAIRKPAPSSKRMLVFRGLTRDDRLFEGEKGKFLMAKVLTKNQGNYNRRLRSLSTMRHKIGYIDWGDAGKAPPTLSAIMYNHSVEPKGSPFLSTSNADTATGFSDGKTIALLIDERRILKNAFTNGFATEFERLIPLFTFPDEYVIVAEDGNIEKLAKEELKRRNITKYLKATSTGWSKKAGLSYAKATAGSCEELEKLYSKVMKIYL